MFNDYVTIWHEFALALNDNSVLIIVYISIYIQCLCQNAVLVSTLPPVSMYVHSQYAVVKTYYIIDLCKSCFLQ